MGLVRSEEHQGAQVLVSLPSEIPLVILRGSGETTAALARLAAEHGVRTLAHAEGGGVLYVHPSADRERHSLSRRRVSTVSASAIVSISAWSIVRHVGLLPDLLALFDRLGLEVRSTERARFAANGELPAGALLPLDDRLGHEWANDAARVATVTLDVVDDLEDAIAIANSETSGLAAAIVAEDGSAAARFLDGYRGTAAFWQAPTRFTDGYALTGAPETGNQRRLDTWAPWPGYLPRPLAPPVPRHRRRDPAPMTGGASSADPTSARGVVPADPVAVACRAAREAT